MIRHRLHEFIDTRLLLMTKSQWLRVYNGKLEKRRELMELSFIRNIKPTRGAILDFFTKVESLIREMIQAKMLGLFSNQGYEFDDLAVSTSYRLNSDAQKLHFHTNIFLLKSFRANSSIFLGLVRYPLLHLLLCPSQKYSKGFFQDVYNPSQGNSQSCPYTL